MGNETKFRRVRQHGEYTDGIACMQSVLFHFGLTGKVNAEQELRLFDKYHAHSVPGVLPSGIAAGLGLYKELEVCLYLSAKNLGNTGFCYPHRGFEDMLREEEGAYAAHADDFRVVRDFHIGHDFLGEQLSAGRILIMLLQDDHSEYVCNNADIILPFSYRKERPRWVTVYGWNLKGFLISDPAGVYRNLPWDSLKWRVRGSAGMVCISVGKRKQVDTCDARERTADSCGHDIIKPDYELLYWIRSGLCDNDTVEELAEKSENINGLLTLPDTLSSNYACMTTYLMEAVRYCNEEAVRALLKAGADPDFYDGRFVWDEFNALFEAIRYARNDSEIAEQSFRIAALLLQAGADPDLKIPERVNIGESYTIRSYVQTRAEAEIESKSDAREHLYAVTVLRLFRTVAEKRLDTVTLGDMLYELHELYLLEGED